MLVKNLSRIVLVTLLGAIGMAATALKAEAGQLMTAPANDAAFNQLINGGLFTETFVSSSRIGKPGNADYELGLLKPDQSVASSAQYNWVNGQAENFSLTYSGGVATYKVGNQTISSSFIGGASDIFLRTRSANGTSTSLFSDLQFQDASGTIMPMNLASSGTGDVDYMRIGNIQGPFTITGKTTFTWSGTQPAGSAMIAQIKVGTSKSTPEPATLGALALVVGGAAAMRRKRG
jgi:hypothetical protein